MTWEKRAGATRVKVIEYQAKNCCIPCERQKNCFLENRSRTRCFSADHQIIHFNTKKHVFKNSVTQADNIN
jgi:hypothetical protein